MKSKFNWRYLNVLIVLLIVYVVYLLQPLWWGALKRVFFALLPILIAFIIAFILNPIVTFSKRKLYIPRIISAIISYVIIISLLLAIIFFILKPMVENINILNGIHLLLDEVGALLNVNVATTKTALDAYVNGYIDKITDFFTATDQGTTQVIGFVFSTFVTLVVGIIFLVSFEKMKEKSKGFLKNHKDLRMYNYVAKIYHELGDYVQSELLIAGIQFIEYGLLYLVISIYNPAVLPYVLVIALMASIFSLIPYFGGYLSIGFSVLIALSLPNPLSSMIPILLFALIFPNLDAYVINPFIFKKKLELNPVFSIGAILVFSALFGIVGIIVSIPAVIIGQITYNTFKEAFKSRVKQFKESF